MEKGDLKVATRELKGWKVTSTEFRENEFVIRFALGKRGTSMVILKGIISSRDTGSIGKPLREMRIEDKGSLKVFALHRPKGGIALRCEYLEGEIR